MISDLSSDRCKFAMPNTFACREELFPTAVAERLQVNVWRWVLKLLPKTKIRWQHFQSLTQMLANILCLTYPCDTPSLTAILCHVTITWWETIIMTVCSKSCWSFSYIIVHIHSVHGFGEKDRNVKKWKFWSYSVEHCTVSYNLGCHYIHNCIKCTIYLASFPDFTYVFSCTCGLGFFQLSLKFIIGVWIGAPSP